MLHAVPRQIPAFVAMEFLRHRALIAASTEIETANALAEFVGLSKRLASKAGLVIPKMIAGSAAIGSPQESNRTGSKRPESTRAIP